MENITLLFDKIYLDINEYNEEELIKIKGDLIDLVTKVKLKLLFIKIKKREESRMVTNMLPERLSKLIKTKNYEEIDKLILKIPPNFIINMSKLKKLNIDKYFNDLDGKYTKEMLVTLFSCYYEKKFI